LASLDLVGAVLRQGTFVEKMVRMEWTRPGRFDHSRDSAPLVRSVARYHAFLDLMQVITTTLCVPTLVSGHRRFVRFALSDVFLYRILWVDRLISIMEANSRIDRTCLGTLINSKVINIEATP